MKKIIGIAGPIGCGKSTVARYIVEEHKGSSHRVSDILRNTLDRYYLDHSLENMQKLSTAIRKAFGEDVLTKVFNEDVKNDEHEIIVIDGVRRLEDFEYLRKYPNFKLFFIEADMDICYERIVHRRENPDDGKKTFKEFKKENEHESEQQIKDLKNYANFTIDNNGDFKNLYKQVGDLLKSD